ncbi:MAG: exodeoxyribonuclease VII large subunit [Pirellulales bacterium]
MAYPSEEDASPATDAEQVLSVEQLTLRLKGLLEESFPAVWVTGEISNFSRPSSGHCYFTLKDDAAQIRAVMWRGTASRLKFDLHDGLEVVCFGAIDVYAQRGSYQLVVSKVEPKGIGALELALRKLKEKLAAEGLFDRARKRPLPKFPRRIAFVTSPTGAAVRDFLEVLRRRWRGADVLIVPTRVQGDGAAQEIAAAIKRVNSYDLGIDVLVVGRGGGSLEDLWCFNEEPVVRAVAGSQIPTISAVGHEIDVTLCDLAADVRGADAERSRGVGVAVARSAHGVFERPQATVARCAAKQSGHGAAPAGDARRAARLSAAARVDPCPSAGASTNFGSAPDGAEEQVCAGAKSVGNVGRQA